MLAIQNAVKSFGEFTLGPINLALRAGRAYGLLGPNGAGKTTLLNVIAAQLRLSSGDIALDESLLTWGAISWKTEICLIRESPAFYDELTAAETLRLAASLYSRWDHAFAMDAMNRFSVDPKQVVGTMSKGTKVKLGLVAALAFQTKVLLLDEPSAGLDPTARAELQDLLLEIERGNPGLILIISSHIFEDIERVAQEVIVLREGQVILATSFEALAASSIITLPSTTKTFPVAGDQLAWFYKGKHHVLVRNDGELFGQLAAAPAAVVVPALDNLSLLYRAAEDHGKF